VGSKLLSSRSGREEKPASAPLCNAMQYQDPLGNPMGDSASDFFALGILTKRSHDS
jgi:hypothetical protein